MFSCSKILSFKALFLLHPITNCVVKMFGRGPREVVVVVDPPSNNNNNNNNNNNVVVEEYLKFDSSTKSFKSLTAVKSFSSAVDAFVLNNNNNNNKNNNKK